MKPSSIRTMNAILAAVEDVTAVPRDRFTRLWLRSTPRCVTRARQLASYVASRRGVPAWVAATGLGYRHLTAADTARRRFADELFYADARARLAAVEQRLDSALRNPHSAFQ